MRMQEQQNTYHQGRGFLQGEGEEPDATQGDKGLDSLGNKAIVVTGEGGREGVQRCRVRGREEGEG